MKYLVTFPSAALLAVSLYVFYTVACHAQASEFSGMVWERHGDWHVNGGHDSVRLGEAVAPGSLLTGGTSGAPHSLVILMPDGQHLLCECFDASRCSQGFRIPAITPPPTPAVWNMFVGVRNVLLLRPANDEMAFPLVTGREALASSRELVATMSPPGDVSLAPALSELPSDQYSLSVTRDDGSDVAAVRQRLNWVQLHSPAPLHVGGPGTYRVRIFDQNHTTRIEIELLVTSASALAAETAGLAMTRKVIMQWSAFHPGWSLHDFLRVYLQSRAMALAN